MHLAALFASCCASRRKRHASLAALLVRKDVTLEHDRQLCCLPKICDLGADRQLCGRGSRALRKENAASQIFTASVAC